MTNDATPASSADEPEQDVSTAEPEHDDSAEKPAAKKPSKPQSLLKETAIIVVSALVLSVLIKTFLVQAFYIPSGSMNDTLLEGDRVMVSRLTPGPFDLRRGDIVVFKDPGGWLPPQPAATNGVSAAVNSTLTFVGLRPQDSGEHLIKRVIGLPGDQVTCCTDQGEIAINGQAIQEPYLAAGAVPSQIPFNVTVPEGMLFVLGDNRLHSEDSRFHAANPGGGFVPIDNVVGRAFVILWPLSRLDILSNPTEVFEKVSEP